tara:strand:- start:268 stop:438 length:171 start_codon:yes stop_codon:yes gene_type:complete
MSDTSFTVIQELKAQLVIELRKNHALDRKLGKLGEFLIVFSHTPDIHLHLSWRVLF